MGGAVEFEGLVGGDRGDGSVWTYFSGRKNYLILSLTSMRALSNFTNKICPRCLQSYKAHLEGR